MEGTGFLNLSSAEMRDMVRLKKCSSILLETKTKKETKRLKALKALESPDQIWF